MFLIRDFEWDKGNAEKNWLEHQVTRKEAEECFFTDPVIIRMRRNQYYIYSVTEAGHRLFGFFLLKPGRIVRVVSIREMDKKERRFYKEKKGW
jgi:uncharacterized DUF497 family protein